MSNSQVDDNGSFFKFRDEQTEKLRKREEMKLEYQRFKALEEERFRNRFASKKAIKANNLLPQNQIARQNNSVSAPNINASSNNNMEVLLTKLDTLQQLVEDLKSSQSKTNNEVKTDSLPINSSAPTAIDDAVKRLNELENTIKTLNMSENGNKISSSIAKVDQIVSPQQLNTILNADHQTSNRNEKQRYAEELKQQIEEKQRQKALQRQKEQEEDLIKLAETLEYDSLGHRIREKPPDMPPFKSINAVERKPDTFARGGNGIFGEPLTESQKLANERYRNELMFQIEEKRLREEKRKQLEKELELKDLEKVLNNLKTTRSPSPISSKTSSQDSEPSKSEQVTSPSKNNARKQSACVQVAIERRLSRPKAIKVVRRAPPLKEKPTLTPKMDQLLAEVTQLKIELAAERLRMEQDRAAMLDSIRVYDPRSVSLDMSPSKSLKKPIKVHRLMAKPIRVNAKSRSIQKILLSSSTQFLPQIEENKIYHSPSLDTLNLDEINKHIKQRHELLRINGSHEDLYRNEPSIIRDFMAEEEPKLIANPGYF